MRQFLVNLVKFFIVFSIAMTLLLLCTLYICSFISFKIPHEKNIIVIGDSHTECAINDNIFSRSINISQSGDAYLYSYLKLREFLRINPHVNKVILSFHRGSIDKSRDNWITGEKYIKAKVPKYISLFNKEEYFFMMKEKAFYSAAIKFPIYSIKVILKYITKKEAFFSDLYIGGFLSLDRDKLNKDVELEENTETDKNEYSLYELNNLHKIVELCKQYNVELIFFNSPIYASEKYGKKESLSYYYNLYFPSIKYLDFSDFNLPLYGYGDITHLNYKGAEIFSTYLENNYETIF